MRKITFLCAAVALMVGCNPDKPNPGPDKEYTVIGFENAELLTHTGGLDVYYDNILWGKELATENEDLGTLWFDDLLYTEDIAGIGSFYTDYWGMYDVWGGFALSNNKSMTASGYEAQFYVAAETATTFAVGYDTSGINGAECEIPTIWVSGTQTFSSAEFANSSYTYNYALSLNSSDLWYTITATGYLNGVETGAVAIELVKNGVPQSVWREVSLEALGEVDKIVFRADSNDKTGSWLNIPAYFCIDNLKYEAGL